MTTRHFGVDRVENQIAVLIADDGTDYDVRVTDLPVKRVKEGDVLKVQLSADGSPEWRSASRDNEERRRRMAEAERILRELKSTDPGGDLVL